MWSFKSNSGSEIEGYIKRALILLQGGLYNVLIFEYPKFNKKFVVHLLVADPLLNAETKPRRLVPVLGHSN